MSKKIQISPLKWVGSKSKVLPQLFELPQFKNISKYDAFVEPFVGGGNVFLNVDHDNIIISDNNPDLILFYNFVKDHFEHILIIAKQLFLDVGEEIYYINRTMFNELPNNTFKAALFLYLNKVGFRGLCRYSKKSGFNVGFGHYKKVNFPEKELIALHEKLQNVTICCGSFSNIFENHLTDNSNYLGYCDPPYVETFGDYTKEGFNLNDHLELNRLATKSKSDIIISNSVQSKEIYTPKSFIDIDVKRGMSHDKGDNKSSRNVTETILIY